MQDGPAIPVGHFGLRTGLADAVDGGQQQIVSRRGSGPRFRPERFQCVKDAGLLGGQPQGAGQAEVDGGGREGDGSGAVLDQGGEAFGGSQIGLLDDAGLAIDAGALDDVVVELVGFLLVDDASHIG
jgi:hypothetical protein